MNLDPIELIILLLMIVVPVAVVIAVPRRDQ